MLRDPMAHPVVEQLRFTRSEWLRGLKGLTEEDGAEHCGQMNSVSWIVGHLTWQEQRYLLDRAQGVVLFPDVKTRYAYGAPMSTPSLAEMLKAWRKVTKATDALLDSLTTKSLLKDLLLDGKPVGQSYGSGMHRLTFHYWYHIGEIQAIRQLLGQKNLPDFVGDIEKKAPYQPERG